MLVRYQSSLVIFYRSPTSLQYIIYLLIIIIFSSASSEKPDYFSSASPNTDNTSHPERCQAADARTARRRGNADAAHQAASGCGSSFRFECATRQAAAWSGWRLSGSWRVGHAGDHHYFVRHGCSCQSTFCCCRHSDQVKPMGCVMFQDFVSVSLNDIFVGFRLSAHSLNKLEQTQQVFPR